MGKYFAFLALNALLALQAFSADTLTVRVEPKEPLVNENFKVVFEVNTEEGTDPIINFDPLGVEVVSKTDTGIRTKTTYINGKLSTERTISVAYEMLAPRAGSAYLRNIKVDLNGKELTHKTIRLNILSKPRRSRDVFAKAEVDKTEAFIGESMLVRYYLYSKVPVVSTEIRKFPKLDDFLKRYHQEQIAAERVEVNGEIYTRRVLYTAQLFAEKAGQYKIDPITLGVTYSRRGANPFDSFGFGSRYGARKMTVASPVVSIKVKELPADGVPASFTGLVGKHSFKLELNKNRFVVNEPIELKLVVDGSGALELYDAPRVFERASIEEFETSADLSVRPNFTASKTFLYTYLGRSGERIKDKKIPFSYFDPKELVYKTEYADLGEIVIAGTSSAVAKPKADTPAPPASSAQPPIVSDEAFEPVYKLAATYRYNAFYIALVLGLILLAGVMYGMRNTFSRARAQAPGIIEVARRNGLDYATLHALVSKIGNGGDMREIVSKSELSGTCKSFLLDTIERCESEYQKSGESRAYKVPRKNLKELSAMIGKKC